MTHIIPPWETIVETKVCTESGQEFVVTDKDMEFYDKISPIFDWKKYSIPSPKLHLAERTRRRLCLRNESCLYHRKCDKSGRQIISIYSPDKPYTVYDQHVWWSDDWNAFDYWKSYDFNSTFHQYHSLLLEVPHSSLWSTNPENSDYTNFALNMKNSYLAFGWGNAENCLYVSWIKDIKDCVDSFFMNNCEYCYDCIICNDCSSCQHVLNSARCTNSLYLHECSSCTDCIMCCWLHQKQYYFLNEYVWAERIKELRKNRELLAHPDSEYQKQYTELSEKTPHRFAHIFNSENCTGDAIYNSKSCYNCYDIINCHDCKNITNLYNATGTCDANYAWPFWANHSYNICSSTGTSHSIGTFLCWKNSNIFYCQYCFNSSDCFGCVGLKFQKNCIFNTPYSQNEYEKLSGKIAAHMQETGEWWEFFPVSMSPFGYNETVAQEYMPLSQDYVHEKQWTWKDEDRKNTYSWQYYEPMSISQYTERLVGTDTAKKNIDACLWGILKCRKSWRPFKIIAQELIFYIEQQLSLPTVCPDERHLARLKQTNSRTLHERTCDTCQATIHTTYSTDRPEKVVCEECYQKAVY